MSNTQQPFLGVFRTQAGELMDLYSGQVITPAQVKPNMPPFNGVFLDKDGVRRDLAELITGGGGGAMQTYLASHSQMLLSVGK